MATQNPYSDSLLMDAFRGSLSNAESLGRGFAVAPVGLLGDVNALARQYITPRLPSSVQGLLQAVPAAPTTEQILANIPRASAPRRESAGMEQLGAAMNPRGPVELARGAGRVAGGAVNEAMVYGRGPLASITPQPMRMVDDAGKLLKTKQIPDYPLAPSGTRYEEFSGDLTYMTPDEFLQKVRPLTLDEESLDNIAALKAHVQSGGKLDPLHIYSSGKEDGRHRAYLAKELGIDKVPVALHGETFGLLGQQAKSASTLPTDYYELNSMATQAYADLRAKPSQEAADYYKSIMKARDEAANNPSKSYEPPTPDVVPQDYKGQHQAPTKDGGAPLWNLKDIYPDDFYSSQGARFYGDGADEARDRMIVSQMQSMKGRPDKPVTIYRAVPKSVPTKEALNTGDWITLDRQYAKEHGEGALNGDYKIVKKTVKARDLFTNGDSIYEMGYDPQPYIPKSQRGLLD